MLLLLTGGRTATIHKGVILLAYNTVWPAPSLSINTAAFHGDIWHITVRIPNELFSHK